MIVMATAAFSILLVVAQFAGTLRRISPAVVIPLAFAVNAGLLLVEWALADAHPAWIARAVYLQVSGPRPDARLGLLADCHRPLRSAHRPKALRPDRRRRDAQRPRWRADRRTRGRCIRRHGHAAGSGGIQPVCAMADSTARPARSLPSTLVTPRATTSAPLRAGGWTSATDLIAASPQLGLRALSKISYLRNLAMLVVLGTIAAALADYVFKVRAVEAFGNGDALLRFFAIYYAATSLLAFVIQTTSSSAALEKLGLAVTASTPSVALAATGIGCDARCRASRACSSPAAASRYSAARCSARDTSCSSRPSRLPRSARPSRSSTSASIASAMPLAADSSHC